MNYKEKIEEILYRWAVYDAEGVEYTNVTFSEAVKALTSLCEQAQRDAVKGFADRIKHEFMDCSAENAEDWSLVSMSYRQFTDFVDEYLNQTKEDLNPKEGE